MVDEGSGVAQDTALQQVKSETKLVAQFDLPYLLKKCPPLNNVPP